MKSSDTNPSSTLKSAYNNGYLLAAIVVLLLGLSLGLPRLRQFPAFIHAWAQADRYALAIGFVDNGHDLFHPQTMIYNKQFPHHWMVDDGSTITAVDFPIHEYIISLLMSLFGTTAPWVFRGFTLLISLAGMWFLFLLARRLTGDVFKALLVTIVAMTSPLYAYYFANYLPSAPSLALSIVALWAYIVYHQSGKTTYWHIAIGLAALATLVRTSQAVLLIALCAFEALRILRRETTLWNKMPAVLVAAMAIVGYMLWNNHLRNEYGSLFLNSLLPPRSWDEVDWLFDYMKEQWRFDYFSRLQHWLIAVCCLAAALLFLLKRKQGKGVSLGWLAVIWWIGEICFFVAMMRQYRNHDYYFLDSFFLPILFTFTLALKELPTIKGHLPVAITLVALVLMGGTMYNNAKHNIANRCEEGDRAYICSQRFAGADRWLDELGVSRDAKLLTLLAYPQNGPFIQMQRKGYTVMRDDEERINAALKFPFDFVVMENQAYEHFITEHPDNEFSYMMECIANNGTLSLFIYHTDEKP